MLLPLCPSLMLVPFKGGKKILQMSRLKKFSFPCVLGMGVNYLVSGEMRVLAQIFMVTCTSRASPGREE